MKLLACLSLRLRGRSALFAAWFVALSVTLAPTTGQGASAAIASAHPLATAAGYRMLERGGNAFDAAVAVSAALAVVEPYSSGLGGGGFFLLHRAGDGRNVMVDGRETAPARVAPEQYFTAEGQIIKGATTQGGTAAGIPGLPAALVHVAREYGRLPLAVSLAPAIALARDGFKVDGRYARVAKMRESFLRETRATVFLDTNGAAPQPGYLLRQPALAVTLEKLARQGLAGFYEGTVAQSLVKAVNDAGGVWQQSDLESYRVVEREPVRFRYRGATITTAPPPSAGGIALAESLGILEQFNVGALGRPDTDHLVIESLRRAFQDRARYLGDADFSPVPIARLTDRGYARRRASTIDPGKATPSEALGEEQQARVESGNTTHVSVIDADGNRVGATLSINLLFGSGIVGGDSGVLLNNEMDDFTLRADVPNSFLLRGSPANAIAPGKRPLSSMTPTFVEDDKGVLVLGAPGGSRIVSMVLLGVLEYLRMPEADVQRLVAMPRYHHQFWPDRVEIEPDSFSPEWRAALSSKGHTLHPNNRKWGNMQAAFKSRRDGSATAASDPRGSGVAGY